MKKNTNHFAGCLIGGALGDALGESVEMFTYDEIIKHYKEEGITNLELDKDGLAKITDDTQLTLFTAEGLLRDRHRSHKRNSKRNLRDTTMVVFRAYLRWLYTQGLSTSNWSKKDYDGWLIDIKELYFNKEASITSITTLGTGMMGRRTKPINNSKTCGSVIRVAPIGLFEKEGEAFELGTRIGAITHGHPSAYYSSGAMALLIDNITKGISILDSTLDVIEELKKHENTKECVDDLEKALSLAKTNPRSYKAVEEIGEGKDATQALAIGVYCALSYPDDIVKALCLAVNHSGNSDSTGSITGNIVGANVGLDNIPKDWIENLQLAKEIETVANDLYIGYLDDEKWHKKYPSW